MGLPKSTNQIFKADISTDNNEDPLAENNHLLENNNESNLNRGDKLLKNDYTDKEKQISSCHT